MPTFSFTIPVSLAEETVEAFSNIYSYDEESGLTEIEYAKKVVRHFIRDVVIRHRAQIAEEADDNSDLDAIT